MAKDSNKVVAVKVGKVTAAPEAPVKVKPEKKAKPSFLQVATKSGAKVAIDANGKLMDAPDNWTPAFSMPKATDFANRAHYYNFRAVIVDRQLKAMTDRKLEFLSRAEEAVKGVDPRKAKIKKIEKLRAAIQELEAQLKAEGLQI